MGRLKAAILPVDVIGGTAAAIALAVAAYFGLFKSDSASAELADLRNRHVDMQAEHSRLQKSTERNLAEYRSVRESAELEGKLDAQLAIEERLRRFRRLADRHGWEELQIMPLEWRCAADVAEHSFTVSASSEYPGLLSLFAEFENSTTWADVSHLTVEPIQRSATQTGRGCRIGMTLNFYSSYPPTDQEIQDL